MWGLWFFPLIGLLFLVGAALGLIWFLTSSKDRRPKIAAVVAVPIGCAGIPVLGLILLAAVGNLLQKTDTQLYEEIFGHRPTISEDRMLFDDFESGRNREIFMRAEPTNAELRRLLSGSSSVTSEYTLDQFIARGAQHGFTWWVSANPTDNEYCKSARIIDAHGFRGWIEFRIAECLDGGTDPFARWNVGKVYVVASRRVVD